MSKTHAAAKKKGGHHAADFSPRPMPDGAVWIGLLLIGAFAVGLTTAAFDWPWREPAVGYAIAVALLVNLAGWRAYAGRELAGWQHALARLPLRFAGFGTAQGKPLAAANGDSKALGVLVILFIVSLALAAGLVWWVMRS